MPEIQKLSLKSFISKISQILGNLGLLDYASAVFSIDEYLFGVPKGSQKFEELTKHPNFRKKIWEPDVDSFYEWIN